MQKTDIAIFGGGIAGLWLLNLLISKGYSAVLLEHKALGGVQTIASQGLIHGGIKYALNGFPNNASETIATMPARWQACLKGQGTLDLSRVSKLSQDVFMFSNASLSSRATAFFASKAIKGRIETAETKDLPAVFRSHRRKGSVYRLQDFVIDTLSLVKELSRPHLNRIYTGFFDLTVADGKIKTIHLADGTSLCAHQYILAAGTGNGGLIHQLGLPVEMQLRPLKQVIMYGTNLPELYAHAIDLTAGDKPRLTITTHYLNDNSACWYLGGQLAETGVSRSDQAQIELARQELNNFLPWMDFSDCNFRTYRIDRAEPSKKEKKRPDTPYAKKFGNTIVCWPTKLTLAPLLGDKVTDLIKFEPKEKISMEIGDSILVTTAPWALNN